MRTKCGIIFAAVMLAAGLGCERRGDAASFAEFDARARAGENLTVAYFGCSLMWSANASEPNETGFRGVMSRYLEKRYPKAHFCFVDAAVGGTGAMLGVFGEANENALTAAILCDGEKVADFNAYHKAGKRRLFFWRDVLLKDYGKGESMVHKWTIDPIPDGKGEFRIGAICTATIKPEATFAGDDDSDFDISAIDHARGVK